MDAKVDCYCASLWRGGHVMQTLKSLSTQPEFGTATIICNNWSDQQWDWIKLLLGKDSRITLYRGNNEKESNEKLRYIGNGNNQYILLFDDDIIYADDYLNKLIKGVDKYNAMVSLHGVILYPLPIRSYYRDRQVFRALGQVSTDVEVDMASNCGSMFKRSFFSNEELTSWYDMIGEIGMDDIYVAYFMKQKGIKRMVLAHNDGYITHKKQMPDDNYIFNKYAITGNDSVQTLFINKYWR